MLAKITSKNQLTLPKAVVQEVGGPEYFDIEVRHGQIVLTPVRIQRGDAVRAKLAALGLVEADVADAVRWARAGGTASSAADPGGSYSVSTPRAKAASRKKPARHG